MKLLLALAPLALVGCTTLTQLPASPAVVTNQTVLDEKVAIGIEVAYTAASKAAALAIRTGVVTNRATMVRIGELDAKAYAAVRAVRAAYGASNAANYHTAFVTARTAIADIIAAF